MPLQLDIVTPEGVTFSGKVDSVVIPSLDGELGIRELSDELEAVDAYMYSLEALRGKIIGICSKYL